MKKFLLVLPVIMLTLAGCGSSNTAQQQADQQMQAAKSVVEKTPNENTANQTYVIPSDTKKAQIGTSSKQVAYNPDITLNKNFELFTESNLKFQLYIPKNWKSEKKANVVNFASSALFKKVKNNDCSPDGVKKKKCISDGAKYNLIISVSDKSQEVSAVKDSVKKVTFGTNEFTSFKLASNPAQTIFEVKNGDKIYSIYSINGIANELLPNFTFIK